MKTIKASELSSVMIVPKDGQLVEVWFRNSDGKVERELATYHIDRGFVLTDPKATSRGVAIRWQAPNTQTQNEIAK